jgi:predicted secreted Zn-dependent protease
MFRFLLLGMALMAIPDRVAQIDVPRRPPAPISDLPNVTVATYAIRAESGPGLIAAMDRAGPVTRSGVRVPAMTEWRNTVGWASNAAGCLPATARLEWSITVTLPVLADDLDIGPRLRERWRDHALQIEAFEYGRVERINAGMEAMLASMRAATDCEGLAQARRRGEQAVADASARYDAETMRARRAVRPLR